MWHTTRYEVVLRAYPPHDPVVILPGMARLLEDKSGQRLAWHLEGEPSRPVPTTQEGWGTLAKGSRNPRYGALDLFFDSADGGTMSLSVDAPSFVRTFDVMSFGFDLEHLSGPKALFSFDTLYGLLIESMRLFGAFSAEVSDRELVRRDKAGKIYLSVDVTKIPDIVHWFNFFDSDMAERLGGKDKLLRAPAYLVEEVADPPGIVLVLQREPFDYHKGKHRQRWQDVTRYLDLERLHRLYPKVR